MLATVLIILAAYLLGSLSFAVILSKLAGMPDPRSYGSGNPGATNVLRTGRKAVAVFTLLGDGLKGVVAVWLAHALSDPFNLAPGMDALAGLAAFVGHLWPVFFRFQGGKGVATALGVILALSPVLGLITLLVWLAVFAVTRISSLSALTAAACTPFAAYALAADTPRLLALLALTALVFWRHRANIRRLLAGEEGRFRKK